MAAVILIVDDHPVVPLALRGLIENRISGVRALQAASLRQARSVYESEPELAVTILDLRLPDAAGLEGVSDLRALRPDVPVVVFTGLNSEPLRQSAIAMGASGIVSKNENASVLLETVSRLIAPKLPPDAVDGDGGRTDAADLPELSPRQQQMWQAIAEGLSNIEIAERYSISLNTTKAHVRELLNRLGVRNRTEAATLYYRARTAK
ncbi:MAG TPA: response regulator transcription factor [Burkholderiaceae bacterium]|jgi:two-component system, NarL family, nitrate/nitrite response regulator NarL|nr:response regulator transcription factor [Burkholderiaceae bacterium]